MRRPLSARFRSFTGRSDRAGQAMPEFAIVAVLVVVAGIGAAGLLGNAFGSSRAPAAEPATDPSLHQVTRQITERSKHRSVVSKDAERRP